MGKTAYAAANLLVSDYVSR
ncbi:hypothetical protein F4W66_25085 (plasmid) [Escherichia coli]|nr:hypothetical protein F4W66_25085 [Escherichia coli]